MSYISNENPASISSPPRSAMSKIVGSTWLSSLDRASKTERTAVNLKACKSQSETILHLLSDIKAKGENVENHGRVRIERIWFWGSQIGLKAWCADLSIIICEKQGDISDKHSLLYCLQSMFASFSFRVASSLNTSVLTSTNHKGQSTYFLSISNNIHFLQTPPPFWL